MRERLELVDAARLVVKVGSSSLTASDGTLDEEALDALVDALAEKRRTGTEIVLVTSGAVAAGLGPLRLVGRSRIVADSQAAASVGMGLLIARYTAAFGRHELPVGQILLTSEDTVRRGRYRNAARTFERLLAHGAVPIVNENDALVTAELRFGDNDRLAALVAQLVRADALLLFTDVDALYDGPPSRPGTKPISVVDSIDELEGVEVSGRGSAFGTGGMVTKLQSADMATSSGIPVVLTSTSNVRAALAGEDVGTWFRPTRKRASRLQVWLEHAAQGRGRLVLDAGAVRAIVRGTASLLPAGIVGVEGDFGPGEPVELVDEEGTVVARGIVAFDSSELPDMLGRSTRELRERLGDRFEREVVHRDDLALVAPVGREQGS
ncbi:glutamate 5-kinase [Pseudoclavibacter chungangensis]|uniref:Glutamate 5-kinase n=1 Tax=Pseudoclavibacter chungangensis TaxID=587635 RepID=A0A7J5BUY3_9MICO|nr:glutamate 5-kinase [Pseudoclavibacter chungangensis]KAB1657349.1 glutamate 5-kinase [Pseudoclavibacter chungangensis]